MDDFRAYITVLILVVYKQITGRKNAVVRVNKNNKKLCTRAKDLHIIMCSANVITVRRVLYTLYASQRNSNNNCYYDENVMDFSYYIKNNGGTRA